MGMPIRYKTIVIIALSILVISLLPGVALVWAETGPNLVEKGFNSGSFIPLTQGEESIVRPPASVDDMIVQFGAGPGEISTQSDGSGVEIIPASAFIHSGENNNSTQADDWFFYWGGGYVRNDSANSVCMVAPVYLPPGNVIDSFTVYLIDNSVSDNLSVYLDRVSMLDGYDELARVQSSGNNSSIQVLTDPSILSTNDQNIISVNAVAYYTDFCFPANSGSDIRINAVQINYSKPSGQVYLPILVKGLIVQTTLSIRNETGGTLDYSVYSGNPAGGGGLFCSVSNLPNGATNLCGTFPAGTQWLNAVTTGCTPQVFNDPFTYPDGTCTRVVRCTGSVWEGAGCNN